MDLLTSQLKERLQREVVHPIQQGDHASAAGRLPQLVSAVHAAIPAKKRVSFGIYSVVKLLGEALFEQLEAQGKNVLEAGGGLYDACDRTAPGAAGVALSALAMFGQTDVHAVCPYFEHAAASDDWMLREFAQGLVRRLIRANPDEMKAWYLCLVDSDDPNLRRFVSESLRPVVVNRRFQKNPDYPLSVLRRLFFEAAPYPRTSVGNNLSDLARGNPELVLSLVEELVASGDKNALWIAHRACRNLVKKQPQRVMDILGVDEYRYKKAVYRRQG